MTRPIAIVGMACRYPDANSPAELWENVLAQRRAFRRLPPERLRAEDYFASDRNAPDRTYAVQAAVIKGYTFDRRKFKVVGSTFRAADLAHWLALEVAADALADAGFADGCGLPADRTGVVLGNTLTGEFSRASLMRYRWPYVRRTLEEALNEAGWRTERRRAFLEKLEADYKSPFAPVGEESLAGGLSNTIAGRICNHFDLKGGGYTVDGACASSLLAVTTACGALASGDLEVALAGGVDLSLDPFEIVGFAKAGALAADEMRVFDARSEGFWPGEGCGFVVLMRYEDALAQGRRVYAVVRGWGVSSDGSGGLTRPEMEGQTLALRRAYQRAQFGIETVGYFEAHGTGTPVGDATELSALLKCLGDPERLAEASSGGGTVPPACEPGATARTAAHAERAGSLVPAAVLGSIKANIGHTKAAAGVAGLIKATLALDTQVVPPTTGCHQPREELARPDSPLRVTQRAEPWPVERPLRAAVSSMGFGGINAHVVLEGVTSKRRQHLTSREDALWRSAQDAEVFLLSGTDTADLRAQVERLQSFAAKLSFSELTDLAAELGRRLHPGRLRAALVASKPSELADGLDRLAAWLAEPSLQPVRLDFAAGVFLGECSKPPRLGFLFPGQGSPTYLDGGLFRQRFATVDELYNAHPLPADPGGAVTHVAQPAIVTASLAGLRVLREWGLEATVAIGHSLGELTAYHWAGAFDEASLLRLVAARGRAMAELGDPTGAMASLEANEAQARALLNGEGVSIAGLNSPRQTVISGPAREVAAVMERAQAVGLRALRLPVSHAFHSPLVAATAPALARHLGAETIHPLSRPVFSTIAGALLPADADLRELLCRQVTRPVRFLEAVQAAAQLAPRAQLASTSGSVVADTQNRLLGHPGVDLWIEVGPGHVLTGLVREIMDAPAVALDAGGPSLRGLLHAAGAAFALGAPLQHHVLFKDRFTRPFDLDWRPKFFANPCELAPLPEDSATPVGPRPASPNGGQVTALATSAAGSAPVRAPSPAEHRTPGCCSAPGTLPTLSPLELVRQLVAERAELPLSAVTDDSRMLSDLHLNSITVGQLVAELARRLGLPPLAGLTEFANASVANLAQALADLARTGSAGGAEDKKRAPAGVDTWTRVFTVELVEAARGAPMPEASSRRAAGAWHILAPPDHPLAPALRETFALADGCGVVVCLPGVPSLGETGMLPGHTTPECAARAAAFEHSMRLLLEGARAALAMREQPRFVLVQHGWSAAGFARTLHLENPEITTCVVDVPVGHPRAARWVRDEAGGAVGYAEAHYDASGRRREPRLKLLPLEAADGPLPLGPEDVLLVTGGGKGIAAECALGLARQTGVRLALLGRSEPKTDGELRANLQRFDAAGLRWAYFRSDVTDFESTRHAVARAEGQLGPVTALLHGAGTNVPRLINALDEAGCRQTLAPKILGLRNVLASLPSAQLKLLVSFGSIIARAGLPGEADYALANEWLAELTERFHAAHPHCRCLTLEWSVWSGVGMGQRLGRIESLMQHGITPISPDRGVEMLLRLLRQPRATGPVVVSGRFGEPPTLKLARPELPLLRFLEHPRVFYPGVELVVEAELSPQTDPHLEDHVYHGERLFAAVLGLEAMAQVAMALAGSNEPPAFSEVELSRPVVAAQGRKTRIRLAALARQATEIEVVLRSEETGFQVDHFRALCRFESARCPPRNTEGGGVNPAPMELGATSQAPGAELAESNTGDLANAAEPDGNQAEAGGAAARVMDLKFEISNPKVPLLALDPARDLYGELLFHTGRFRRLRGYRVLRAKECLAEIEVRNDAWFGGYSSQDLVLGDPGVRDAAIHAIQACIPHRRLLPVGVERIAIEAGGLTRATGFVLVHARERSHAGAEFAYDLEILSPAGQVLEHWQGLRLRVVEPLERCRPWPLALLGPHLERRLMELAPGSAIGLTFVRQAAAGDPARFTCVPDRQAVGRGTAHPAGASPSRSVASGSDGAGAAPGNAAEPRHATFGGLTDAARRQRSEAALRQLLGSQATVRRRADGKPECDVAHVSTAHAGDVTLAVCGSAEVGCDLERVEARPPQTWQDLLGLDRFRLAELIAQEAKEDIHAAATRVWSAGECLVKTGLPVQAPLVFVSVHGRGAVVLRSGERLVVTFRESVPEETSPLVVAVLLPSGRSSR